LNTEAAELVATDRESILLEPIDEYLAIEIPLAAISSRRATDKRD
jgi:hypothetical protein